jgi:hypothetical protein
VVTDNNFSEQASKFGTILDVFNCLFYVSDLSEDMVKKNYLILFLMKLIANEVGANGLKTVKNNASLENKVNNMIKSVEYIYET